MAQRMAQRVQSFGTSIFTEISALAAQHHAVNLGQGFPDVAGPALLTEAAIAAIQAHQNQSAPSPSLPASRTAIAHSYAHNYGLHYDRMCQNSVHDELVDLIFPTHRANMAPISPRTPTRYSIIVQEPYDYGRTILTQALTY